jgi:hypothetical protein
VLQVLGKVAAVATRKETTMGDHKIRKVVGVMKIPDPDLKLLDFSEGVAAKGTNNVNFTSPGNVFINLTAANTAFSATIQNMKVVKKGGPAKAAARLNVIVNLGHSLDYVNGVASTLPATQGAAAITSCGFPLRAIPVRNKPPLEAKYGGLAGVVGLVALSAGAGAVYVFEYSTDMKTWTTLPQVFKAKTVISGLTVGTTYYFRFQAQTAKVQHLWSDAVSFFVR